MENNQLSKIFHQAEEVAIEEVKKTLESKEDYDKLKILKEIVKKRRGEFRII